MAESGPRFLWRALRRHRSQIALLAALLGASNGLALLHPLFLMLLLDRCVLPRRVELLWPIAGAMAAVILLRVLVGALHRAAFTRLSTRILFELRLRLFRHLQTLSLRWFARTPFGEILSRFHRDAAAIQDFATGALQAVLGAAVSISLVSVFMIWVDWRLFLAGVAPLPLALAVLAFSARRLRRATEGLRQRSAESSSFFAETVSGMRAVQAFAVETSEARRFVQLHREGAKALFDFQIASHLAGGISGVLVTLGGVVLLSWGARRAIEGEIAPGVLLAQGFYLGALFGPMRSLLDLSLRWQEARVSLGRFREYLSLASEPRSGSRALPQPLRGAINFDAVTVRHREGPPVLDRASFAIAPGSVTAIVGPSGIGKTTAVDLVMRFYDPDEGAVRLDGADLRELSLRALRRGIALAPQDAFFHRGSLSENIAFGRRWLARASIEEAARWAGLDPLIARLPQGLETPLGESGSRLSGGERQRISIARAILARPRVLILDEATSALDGLSEKEIRDAIAKLRAEGYTRPGDRGGTKTQAGPTVVLVTHRLSAAAFADQILVLDRGGVVESGTHNELLAQQGLYRRMFDALLPAVAERSRREQAAGLGAS